MRRVMAESTSQVVCTKWGAAQYSPPPITGVPPIPDPLAGLQPPSIGNYPVRHGTSTTPSTLRLTSSGSTTLDPGVYYGGIRATGSGPVTFAAGIYIIAGGELTLGGSGMITAEGVFFYLTRDPTNPTGEGAYAGMSLAGNGNLNVTPMTSGPYRNLTFFQDRQNTAPDVISGNGNMVSGTCYLPSASLTVNTNGSIGGTAQLIADTIRFSGTALPPSRTTRSRSTGSRRRS